MSNDGESEIDSFDIALTGNFTDLLAGHSNHVFLYFGHEVDHNDECSEGDIDRDSRMLDPGDVEYQTAMSNIHHISQIQDDTTYGTQATTRHLVWDTPDKMQTIMGDNREWFGADVLDSIAREATASKVDAGESQLARFEVFLDQPDRMYLFFRQAAAPPSRNAQREKSDRDLSEEQVTIAGSISIPMSLDPVSTKEESKKASDY